MIILAFDEDISSLPIAKTIKIILLPKPVNKISMTSVLLNKTVNGHSLFRLQYNCPVFPSDIQDRRRSGDDLFSPSKLSHGRLPKYLIDGRTF